MNQVITVIASAGTITTSTICPHSFEPLPDCRLVIPQIFHSPFLILLPGS